MDFYPVSSRLRPWLGHVIVACLLLAPSSRGLAWAAFAKSLASNMVLQRDKPLHLWGTAAVGEGVTVTFNGQTVAGQADASGHWLLTFTAMPANAANQTVTLQGLSNTVNLTNVLVGDVWLFSGQSNMEFPLNAPNYWSGSSAATPNGATDASSANLPNVRVLNIVSGANRVSTTPLVDFPLSLTWAAAVGASNTDLKNYSALAFYFCRDLNTALGVPIGMVNAAYGGSPAEAWVSLQAIQAEPTLTPVIPVGTPVAATPHYWPTGLYNGEINPLSHMTLKGIAWDQGESNTNVGVWGGPGLLTSTAYSTLFTVLIKDWRARFGEDLPFVFVQMQNLSFLSSPGVNQAWADNCNAQQTSSNGWGDVRWGEFDALDLTRTVMSVNYDLNPDAMYYNATLNTTLAHTYHPHNKEAFAARLLPWAKNMVYSLSVGAYSGPLYRSYQALGSSVQVNFDKALATSDGLAARGFMVGDSGGTWAWADTVILSGSTAVVSAAAIPAPTGVKYAWGDNPSDTICAASQIANLSDVTQAWLASPFQTLDEPVISVKGNSIVIRDSDLVPQAADGRDLGLVNLSDTFTQTFVIQNTGSAPLILSGGGSLVRVAGSEAADFNVTVQPASLVSAGSSTAFTVSFQPGALGLRQGVLQIPNNDPNRTPYYIYLKGTGTNATTPTPVLPAPGPLQINEIKAAPNPNPTAFMLKLAGPADRCHVTVYSSGMLKVAELTAPGRNSPGWATVPAASLDLANGIYYFTAMAEQGERRSFKIPAGRFMILK
jgi:sialate O-acetylesterase